ncbi:MAG: hypothetical protein RLN88_04230 [Ekhidna sp.]|uniref:hypothetical protein n=1 Tax=Ekhidna sp. TaxID=2608089 RepID=UPI0032EAC792
MKTELSKIAKDLEQGTITEREAETLLLGLFSVTKRFSFVELQNVLRKPKLALISTDLKNILVKGNGCHYNSKEDIAFIEKYAGKKVLVYEWCDDWWICEDDNYPLFKKCFELLD